LYELGLIYKCEVTPDNDVIIQMTLTTPNCPVADEMPKKVKEAVDAVPGVKNVAVDLVWDPPWDMSRMSDVARLELDMM
jgi:metal-sulfur cluster biosynthetic enzyme